VPNHQGFYHFAAANKVARYSSCGARHIKKFRDHGSQTKIILGITKYKGLEGKSCKGLESTARSPYDSLVLDLLRIELPRVHR
jgi:hypothetical protein